ncbi:hypothetical protein GCM10027359_20010 [Marilutibacter aestuarii]
MDFAVATAGVLLCAVGFALNRMWNELPWERLALSLCLAAMAAILAWPVRRLLRWSWATALAVAWSVALVVFVGVVPLLAAALLGIASLAIGSWRLPDDVPARTAVATAIGLVVIGGLNGWLLSWPIHVAPLWYVVLLGVVALRRKSLLASLAGLRGNIGAAIAGAPRWAAFAVTLAGLASTACWLPTMQVDDLAYHMGLPSQLLLHGRYVPDPSHQIWAFAPWLGDNLQGIAAVLARQDARGAMNALWLLLSFALAGALARRLGGGDTGRWIAVALVASFPPLVWMAAGMQTELAATALLFALLATVLSGSRHWVLPAAVLFAGLLGLKTMHALSALPLLAYGAWRHRDGLAWRQLPVALGACLLLGGSSFVLAWWHTGNPVLPLFNDVFQSPYYPPRAYSDVRWFSGFGAHLPWAMTFDTPRYVEAFRGGIGFSTLALSGVWLLALLRPAHRGVAIATTAVVVLPMVPLQYVRYTYPGMLLLAVVLVPCGRLALGRRGATWVFAGLCMLNLAFQANSGWLHHSAALKRTIRALGDESQVFPHYVPERMLLRAIPADDDGIVLTTVPDRNYTAELGGRGRGVLEHDPTLHAARAAAEADASGAGWRTLFDLSGARWVLVVPAQASPALQRALADVSARRVGAIGDAELWRLPDDAKDASR